MISQVKLIAEPWDVGDGGYQVGNFPPAVVGVERQVPRHGPRLLAPGGRTIGELAERLTGSSDLYEATGRRPFASINFVTCHDGFTLADLVSYNDKHNEANGEDKAATAPTTTGRGTAGSRARPTTPRSWRLRRRQLRNLLATLLLSARGVPMLLGGDELGPHPAGQQQRLLPGQPDLLVRLGERRRRTSWRGPAS